MGLVGRLHVGEMRVPMPSLAGALLAAACCCPAAASADPAAPVVGAVDLRAKPEPFPHYWKRCVGSGHMLLGTRSDWRAQLKLAVEELGFTGIRGHGLLDDDMSVVPGWRSGDGRYAYEFYNVDQVFDYLVSLKVKPVVELSFMPKAFVSCGDGWWGQQPCWYAFGGHAGPGSYKGLAMPPDKFQDWHDLVFALAQHLVARYGLIEVGSWHFEVWNEMWGMQYPQPYLSLYNASARALKAVHESLRVGGPATMQTLDVAEFIQAVRDKSSPLPVDFVSTHFYPTDPQCQIPQMMGDIDCFSHTVLSAQHLAKAAGLPFFITEYNNGLGDTSRDDASAAAFVFRQIGLLQRLDMFSWWTFSDIFEEEWMQSRPSSKGFGMMTKEGIRKPVWRAFELLAGAGDRQLPVSGFVSPADGRSDISVLALLADSKQGVPEPSLQLFVANYAGPGAATRFSCSAIQGKCVQQKGGNFTDEALCNAQCGKRAATAAAGAGPTTSGGSEPPDRARVPHNVTLVLIHSEMQGSGLAERANAYRIDADHANPMAKWQALGAPTYPTSEEIAQINAASEMGPLELIAVRRINSTASALDFLMPSNAALQLVLPLAVQTGHV